MRVVENQRVRLAFGRRSAGFLYTAAPPPLPSWTVAEAADAPEGFAPASAVACLAALEEFQTLEHPCRFLQQAASGSQQHRGRKQNLAVPHLPLFLRVLYVFSFLNLLLEEPD